MTKRRILPFFHFHLQKRNFYIILMVFNKILHNLVYMEKSEGTNTLKIQRLDIKKFSSI